MLSGKGVDQSGLTHTRAAEYAHTEGFTRLTTPLHQSFGTLPQPAQIGGRSKDRARSVEKPQDMGQHLFNGGSVHDGLLPPYGSVAGTALDHGLRNGSLQPTGMKGEAPQRQPGREGRSYWVSRGLSQGIQKGTGFRENLGAGTDMDFPHPGRHTDILPKLTQGKMLNSVFRIVGHTGKSKGRHTEPTDSGGMGRSGAQ